MKTLARLLNVIFIFLVSIHFCNAQKIILGQKNYVYHNIGTGSSSSDWSHSFLVEGETEPRKAGYFGQHLKRYVQSDSIAVRYVNSYARHQTFKLLTATSTVVLFSVFGISNLSKESVSPEHMDEPDKNRGCLYVAAGTFVTNLILRIVVPKSIQKAVDSYNQSVERNGVSFNSLNFEVQTISGTRMAGVGLKLNL
jgi:hypothetical protein